MKILHIIAQKPFSTGSGVYLSGLLKAYSDKGYEQYVICGIDENDIEVLKKNELENILWDPVIYDRDLGFPTPGMSDVMPYKAARYSDFTKNMAARFIETFAKKVEKSVIEFRPDLILCEHLYLSTAVSAYLGEKLRCQGYEFRLFGFCHGSDLRQISNNPLMRQYIIDGINLLDAVITTHIEQKEDIERIYGYPEDRIHILGSGFNEDIFNISVRKKIPLRPVKIVYTGKLSFSKGVRELLFAVENLKNTSNIETELTLIGGSSSSEELEILKNKAESMNAKVNFMGILPQTEIAEIYGSSHIFILPSYFEGMPLTIPEALSTGLRVVTTDLPGFRTWLSDFEDTVSYIEKPEMKTIDEPTEKGRADFTENIERALKEQIEKLECGTENDLSHMTWSALTDRIEKLFTNFSK